MTIPTTTVATWSQKVATWNGLSAAQRRQIAEECKRDGHEWRRCSVVVYCQKCTHIDLTASEDEQAA